VHSAQPVNVNGEPSAIGAAAISSGTVPSAAKASSRRRTVRLRAGSLQRAQGADLQPG
jgi:hypothetical protein